MLCLNLHVFFVFLEKFQIIISSALTTKAFWNSKTWKSCKNIFWGFNSVMLPGKKRKKKEKDTKHVIVFSFNHETY